MSATFNLSTEIPKITIFSVHSQKATNYAVSPYTKTIGIRVFLLKNTFWQGFLLISHKRNESEGFR